MAIPFLTHINLNGSELQNAVIQNLGTAPSVSADDDHGRIYYNSDNSVEKMYYWNGTSWISMSGDISRVNITAGNGLTGTVDTTAGDHTQTLNADLKADGGIVFESAKLAVDLGATSITGTLAVGDGGTGTTTFTNGGVLLGSSGGAITAMAVLADGEMIVGDGSTDPVAESDDTLRISIGVGSTSTWQITGLNIGHASNTTLSRKSAGVLQVESNELYVQSGTDVAIADGGTGQSTAALAANALLNTSQGGALSIGAGGDTITIPGALIVTGKTTTNNVETVSTSSGVVFEGQTLDGHDGTLISVAAGSGKTYTLPNVSGYVALFVTDPGTTAIAPTVVELNYVDGVTSAIQTQLDAKQPLDADLTALSSMQSGAATAVGLLTSTEVAILDGATLSTTELNYVVGVTSAIQTQLDTKRTAAQVTTAINGNSWVGEYTANGSTTYFDAVHSLGMDVIIQIYDSLSSSGTYGATVHADIDRDQNSGNTARITFASAPTNGQKYKVMVTKVVA